MRAYLEALESLLKQHIELSKEQNVRLDNLEQSLRESKRQATPFRRKKKGATRKKPGRPPGHEPAKRAAPEPDETHEAPHPRQCSCGEGCLTTVSTYTQTQEDVVTRKVTVAFQVTVGVCATCGCRVEGRHPLQTSTARGSARHTIGPRALAIAAQLHFGQGVPYDKVREHLRDLGLSVSKGTLVRAMKRMAVRGAPTFTRLLNDTLSHDVLHIDETGWSVDGKPCWLWVLSGGASTVYFICKTRSSDEVADFLADFEGVLVTDGAKAYDKLGKTLTRALCLLHLRRNLRALEQSQTAGGVRKPRELIAWIDRAIDFAATKDDSVLRLGRRVHLEAAFEALLNSQPTNAANARMLDRLRQWRDAVIRCIRDPSVPATNNHAERMLRPAVVARKRGGCNRSDSGAEVFEVMTSLLVSARQSGVNFVDWLVGLLRQPRTTEPVPFW